MSQIPERKRTKEEMSELRTRSAMQMASQPIVNPYDKKLARKPLIIVGYFFAVFAPLYLIFIKIQDKFLYELFDLKIMLAGIILALLVALFIFLKRSLSRHHASFIVIVTLISSFSIVSLVNGDEQLKREVQLILGQDIQPMQSEADRIFEESLRSQTENSESVNQVKRELSEEDKALREEARRAFAASEAEAEEMRKRKAANQASEREE